MLNKTRLQTYMHAYYVRMTRGEKVADIDKDYLEMGRITEDDIKLIHKELKIKDKK